MLSLNPLILIWQNIFLILVGLIALSLLIALHEFGHFIFCKLFGIRTPSFSIGFGPRLISKKIGDTVFAISAIPLGGYVEIAGSAEVGQGKQAEAYSTDPHSFTAKPFYQQCLVMFGGILFNILFAYLAMILVCMAGLPKSPLAYPANAIPTIHIIAPESAAEKHGLIAGDTILAINNIPLKNSVQKWTDLSKPLANQKAKLLIERNGKQKTLSVILDEKKVFGKSIGMLGVGFELTEMPGFPFFEAIGQGIKMTNEKIIGIFQVFKYIFTQKDMSNLVGPIGIISIASEGAAQGIKVLLLLLAVISINLAVLNLLPLPILDGGQILFYAIEALIGRPLPLRIREYIHMATWLLMLALFTYLSAKDIGRIAGPYIEALLKLIGW